MVPLYQIEKLPRHQRLRKIAKIFFETENEICAACGEQTPDTARLVWLEEIARSLANDSLFTPAARAAFGDAAAVFGQTDAPDGAVAQRRALNNARHIILTETGRSPADWDFTGSDGRLDTARRRVFSGMWIYLEDIRAPFNVGAMFRTAESFGAEKIFLSPFCADPNHLRARRTAMGCVEVVSWERREFFTGQESALFPDETPAPVFAMETGGIPLEEFAFPRRGILIAGSEELGVSPRALAAADASAGRVSIPCYGAKGSLNVSVAFGIVMQAWARALAFETTVSHNA